MDQARWMHFVCFVSQASTKNLHSTFPCLLNSAQTIPVATAAFNDSARDSFSLKDGIETR